MMPDPDPRYVDEAHDPDTCPFCDVAAHEDRSGCVLLYLFVAFVLVVALVAVVVSLWPRP